MSELFAGTVIPTAQTISSLHFAEQFSLLTSGDSRGQVNLHHVCPDDSLQPLSHFTSHVLSFDRDTIQHESDSIIALECLFALPRSYSLLVANEKVAKLWSVGRSTDNGTARCRRVFQGGHEFRIHSISANHSRLQFLTCDDLTLNLWDVERTDSTYRAADHKPLNIKDLKEVLLHATFHPIHNSLMLTTSTSGTVRIGDLRLRAKMTPPAIELRRPKTRDSQYSDVLCSVTGAEFALSSDLLYSRDFQTTFIWDLRAPVRPVSTLSVTTDLRCILGAFNSANGVGKFEIRAVAEGCITGGYNGDVIAISSTGKERLEYSLPPKVCIPHLVAGSSATFTSLDNSIVALPNWPQFTQL